MKNKKFLETNYPQGRDIEVFSQFHFGFRAKNQNLVFCLTRNCLLAVSTSPKERLIGNPEAEPRGILFD